MFIAYGDSFDLVMKCGKVNEYCKYNINDKGEMVSKLEPWFSSDMSVSNIYGIVTDSKLKAYVRTVCTVFNETIDSDDDSRNVTYQSILTKSDGKQ